MSRLIRGVLGVCLLLPAVAVGLPGPAQAAGGGDLRPLTVTKSVSRVHLQPDGTQTTVDSRTVTLRVSQTRALRGRQPVLVSWSGARPTAGVSPNPNSPDARYQEYPFVIVECRGVDSPTAPVARRISPSTCWTGSAAERAVADEDTGFGPWRLDRYETAVNRQQYVGLPATLPSCKRSREPAERWQHFLAVDGTDYGSDPTGCPSVAPETVGIANDSQPSNNTYGTTLPNGTGSLKFTMWTQEDNASLGCGGGVNCSLVAIPIMGISCDPAAAGLPAADQPQAGRTADTATAACESNGNLKVGAAAFGTQHAPAVGGELWWSESNWRNRLSVPLDFAPLNNACDLTGAKKGVDIYGSELATQLTAQWRPSFCLSGSRVPFKHVQVGEPQAANLLQAGNIDGAFVTDPPVGGFTSDTVQAPLGLTGFAVSYAIDDHNKERYTKLRLTPRLLAKLMTESYPAIQPVQSEYDALARNPLNMSTDPEFRALNPGIRDGVGDSVAASTVLLLSSDSDVISALTSYLNADPEAHDWLMGIPDPWGMIVNPNYSINPRVKNHLTLPTDNWPLRDSFEPKAYYNSGVNPCLQANPVPILPLIAAPTARMATITVAMQFASASSQTVCNFAGNNGDASKLVAEGRQPPGSRFVLGVTSLGDAARYDLDTASLQTYVNDAAEVKMTSGVGRSFVAPSNASLVAAAESLRPSTTPGTWALPYSEIPTSSALKGAYPGAMLLNLAAPTKGLSPTAAKGISELMSFAVGAGQTRGLDIGQMPPGYLALTTANGLGIQRDFTLRAAAAVAAQKGATPLVPGGPPPIQPPVVQPPVTNSLPAPTTTSSAPGGSTTPTTPNTPRTSSSALPPQTTAGPQQTLAAASTGVTAALRSAIASELFPILLLVAAVGLVTAVALSTVGRPKGTP